MLAITTTALSIVDPSTLKRPPSSLPSCLSLLEPCAASAWSPDNLYLFLASTHAIHQYNPALNTLTDIYSSEEPVTHLVCKTKSSLVFATANKIYVLESTKVVQTFDAHKTPITSLALSGDFLASTSSGAAHVQNLLLGTQTVLRGLSGQITTCAFHTHSPGRLLLGAGKQLLVYDTARPSRPVKAIPMNDTTTSDIVAVACSPFSKTLVAVASASGSVGLVDLDKEKGLFRTLNLKVPLTSIAFSPEGGSIYLGTENGKLLIMDLRALDKPPKAVVISDNGSRVQTMTAQKKFKESADSAPRPTTTAKVSGLGERRPSTTVVAAKTAHKLVTSPKGRVARIASGASPARRPSPLSALSPRATSNGSPKVFSPVRDPRNNSTSVDDISMPLNRGKKGAVGTAAEAPKSARLGVPSTRGAESVSSGPTLSRLSAASRVRKTSVTESDSAQPDARPRTVSSASISTKSVASRSGFSASRPGSSASQRSSVPPVPALPSSLAVKSASRTPSPDLPSFNGDPTTPLRMGKGGPVLGSPEVNNCIEPGDIRSRAKGKGKTVLFKDSNDENSPEDERERSLSMQISPRRPSSAGLGNSASWAPSPLRNAIPTSPGSGGSSAHDLLRTIVRDVLFDVGEAQRSEMVGLHLDLLKMGRGLKKELRELMEEYVGDLRDLREENTRLRQENEHLRRGY
ncbi:WD40-repeat-containing domain protein [Mycena alexandri]|uniref:WD40-repeat-containing domain protein n=1 Tax=Mycena alexandri TaxID=1745969 RepID=A0AAD6XFY5_9AGAR|nr:WD40-repeat-containing domain protein [Mycena alexandri]